MEESSSNMDNGAHEPDDGQVQVDRSIGGRFQVGTLRYFTRISEAFDALDAQSGESVLLWMLRHRLVGNSEVASRFTRRLQAVQRFGKSIVPLKSFGVDASGVAYATSEPVLGKLLVDIEASPLQVEQLYIKALLAVASLHDQGIVLGDICEHSFLVTEDEGIILQTLLGSYDIEAKQTALLPPIVTLHFVAPEQRSGGGPELAADVYALGVLAYRLFTGRYPYGEQPPLDVHDTKLDSVPAPSVLNHEIPNWVDNFVSKCVEPSLENRYSDVNMALNILEEAIRTDTPPQGSGRWSRRTLIVRPSELRSRVKKGNESQENEKGNARRSQRTSRRQTRPEQSVLPRSFKVTLAVVCGIALGIVGAGVAFVMVGNNVFPAENWQKGVVLLIEGARPELQGTLRELVKSSNTVDAQIEQLHVVAQSDEPTATAVLITIIKSAPSKELLAAAEELIVERLKRQGLHRTAYMLQRWFHGIQEVGRKPAQSPSYSDIFRACDATLPFDARKSALEKAYSREPVIALQFTAALALDDEDHQRFSAVLAPLLAAHLKSGDLEGRSLGALILSYKNLSLFFAEDVKNLIGDFSARDLGFSLLTLAESNNEFLYLVAEETIKRDIVPPFQGVFLKMLVAADHYATPGFVKKSLVLGARGELSGEDIVNFTHWGTSDRERVLFAAAAIARDEGMAATIFDSLLGTPLQEEPGKSLVKWIEKRHWKQRDKAVKAIAILSLWDIASAEQISYAFDELMPFAVDEQLFTTLVETGKPPIIKTAIERLNTITPSVQLIPLLSHSDQEVRIAAVKSLDKRNDLYVLQAITRAYAAEKDEEIKKIYRDLFWVVKDRP